MEIWYNNATHVSSEAEYNPFVVFVVGKGLILVISFMEALPTPVVTCEVVYTEFCGMKTIALVDGYSQLLWI